MSHLAFFKAAMGTISAPMPPRGRSVARRTGRAARRSGALAAAIGMLLAAPALSAPYTVKFIGTDIVPLGPDAPPSPFDDVSGSFVIDIEIGVPEEDSYDITNFEIDAPLAPMPFFDYNASIGWITVLSLDTDIGLNDEGDFMLTLRDLASGPLETGALMFFTGGNIYYNSGGSYTFEAGGATPVPLPATAPLLLAALGGAAALRRQMARR